MPFLSNKIKLIFAIVLIYLGQIIGFIAPALFYETPMYSARFEVPIWATNNAIIVSITFLCISILFSTLVKINLKETFSKKINSNYLFQMPEFTSIFLMSIGILSSLYCHLFSINSGSMRYILYILTGHPLLIFYMQ